MTNMKSHMGFPLTPRSMTLDHLDYLNWFKVKFSWNSFGISRHFLCFGGNNSYTNEDRPVLSATELLPIKCSFQRCIGYVDIAGRSPAMGRQTSTVFASPYHSTDGADRVIFHVSTWSCKFIAL